MKTILFLIVICSAALPQSNSINFVSVFYKAYLNSDLSRPITPDSFLRIHPFFSKSAKVLLDSNRTVCKKKAGTDICGYGADIDMFLNTQETGPNLNFKTSRFRAKKISADVIEISFTVFPNDSSYYDKKRRLKLVSEDGMWRVDDIFDQDKFGKFPKENSMRYLIKKEIDYYK